MSWVRDPDIGWFYVVGKQQMGPVKLAGLVELYTKGKAGGGIGEESLIWSDKMSGWEKLKNFAPLLQILQERRDAAPKPKPPPPAGPPRAPPAAAPDPRGSDRAAKGVDKRGSTGAKADQKHSGVKAFLMGWLPKRQDPRQLVERGILRDDPARGFRKAGSTVQPSAPTDFFGGDLQHLLRRPDTANGIPAVVAVLMERLQSNGGIDGIQSEGIFRIPGDSSEMQGMRAQINGGADVRQLVATCQNEHSVAGLLKMFFRELREPLLTYALYDDFIQCSAALGTCTDPTFHTRVGGLNQLLGRLPPGHRDLLLHLVLFLKEVTKHAATCKMTVGNCAAVFGPNLLRPQAETLEHLADTVHIVNLLAAMIAAPEATFGLAPPPEPPAPPSGMRAPPPPAAAPEPAAAAIAAGVERMYRAASELQAAPQAAPQYASQPSYHAPEPPPPAAPVYASQPSYTKQPSYAAPEPPPQLSAAASSVASSLGGGGSFYNPPPSPGAAAHAAMLHQGSTMIMEDEPPPTLAAAASSVASMSDLYTAEPEPGHELAAPPPEAYEPPPAAYEPPPAAAEPPSWYFVNASNEQEGPVALGDLQEMLKQSRLSLSTYVFSEGMENWTPASQVDAISSGGAGFA